MSTATVADRVRERLLADHAGTVEAVLDCAAAVAADRDGEAARKRSSVADRFADELEDCGLRDDLVDLLESAVDAAGADLPTDPVPAPPYVVVTGRGPVVRATLPEGRLVVTIAAFEVERDPVRYVHRGPTVADALEVRFE